MTDARKLVDDLTTAAGCLSAHGQHDLGMAVARAANLLEPQPPSITTTTGTPWATTVDGPDKPLLTTLPEACIGLEVGPYKLANVNGKIYCGHVDGEGGTFDMDQLLPYLKEFFREHF